MGRYIYTYGGRDPGDGEEAQYRRVEGAVNAHDAEHRPPVRVLEYGSDLHAEQRRRIWSVERERGGEREKGSRGAYSGDGRDGGREKVRVERDLDGGGVAAPRPAAAFVARPRRRLVGARPGPGGDLLVRLARRLGGPFRRGYGHRPSLRRPPAATSPLYEKLGRGWGAEARFRPQARAEAA